MKDKIFLIFLHCCSCFLYPQEKNQFKEIQDIIQFRKNQISNPIPNEDLKKVCVLIKNCEKSGYKNISVQDKLILIASYAECLFRLSDYSSADENNKKFIDLYENHYQTSKDIQKDKFIKHEYKISLLTHAEYLSINTSDLQEIINIINKVEKINNASPDKNAFFYQILDAKAVIFFNAKYYNQAIINSENKIHYLRTYNYADNDFYYRISSSYSILNFYIYNKLVETNPSKNETDLLLKKIDQNVLELQKLNPNKTNWACGYYYKAYVEYRRNNFTEAKKNIEKATKTKMAHRITDYIVAKIFKILIHIKAKEYQFVPSLKQEIEKDSAFNKLLNNNNYRNMLKEYYTLLIKYEKEEKNFQDALDHTEKLQKINFDIRKDNMNIQIQNLQKKYNFSKKNVEIAKLNSNRKQLMLFLIISGNLVLFLFIFIYLYIQKKKRQSKKLTRHIKNITENEIHKIHYAKQVAINELKKNFSMQLHTDIGSALIETSNFLKVKRKLESDVKDLELWDSLQKELQKVYTIVRNESHKIYESSSGNDFLEELEKNIKLIFANSKIINLQTRFNINSKIELCPEIKVSILMMIKEGCTNIIKYSTANNVLIKINNDENFIYVEINDDGKKKVFSNQYKQGIGLQTLKETIENMKGQFSISKTNSGFSIIAKLPYSSSTWSNLAYI